MFAHEYVNVRIVHTRSIFRVIGRIMPGTCRLQAFNVRTATGDDVAILPRRAAVASHHVSKICKEFDITI